ALLGRVVDRVERAVLGLALEREVLRDRGGEARLAVVDMADRPDVDVRLGALELLIGHGRCLTPFSCWRRCAMGRAVKGSWRGPALTVVEPTIGLEPMTSSLPRKCSAS